MNELKFVKADAELQIAELELGAAEEAFVNAPPEDGEVPEDEETEEETEEEDGLE